MWALVSVLHTPEGLKRNYLKIVFDNQSCLSVLTTILYSDSSFALGNIHIYRQLCASVAMTLYYVNTIFPHNINYSLNINIFAHLFTPALRTFLFFTFFAVDTRFSTGIFSFTACLTTE